MKKQKIKTYNKLYPLEKSPLFNINFEKRLLTILDISSEQLNDILKNKSAYYTPFQQNNRDMVNLKGVFRKIHHRIASLLCRLETPNYLVSGKKNNSHYTNALQHKDSKMILTMDITKFYPSTKKIKVFKFFRNYMKCSHNIANVLAELCTINDEIPTGSQVSMPLAFWANYSMYETISEIVIQEKLKFTVYVDDLTFSGDFIPKYVINKIESVVGSFHHKIKKKKTNLYTSHKIRKVTGVIIRDNKLLPPNSIYKKTHERLFSWQKLIKEKTNTKRNTDIFKEYQKLFGLLNYLSIFDKKKFNLLKQRVKEEHRLNRD